MFEFAVAIGLLIACMYMIVSRRNAPKCNVPEYPGALPLIGHGHLFSGKNHVALWLQLKDIITFASSCGGIANFKIGFKQLYMITDPDDCMRAANLCLEKDFVYDFIKPVLGEGLFTGTVSTWKIHKKLLTPAFSQGVLDGFLGVFNSQAKRLVAALDQESGKGPFSSWSVVGPNALETIYLTALGGAECNESLSVCYLRAIEEIYNIVVERSRKIWLHPKLIFNMSSLGKKMTACIKIVHEVSNTVLQNKKKEKRDLDIETSKGRKLGNQEFCETKSKAFIDLILELSGEKGLLTDQEIREEVDTIIVAGHDTSASTIVNTLIVLGSHPEVQERLFKEVEEVIGDREVQKQDFNKLVYLEAVLKESLRLYPIAPFVGRTLTESVQLKNHTLPAGSELFLAFYALHRSKLWGEDADQFDPTRWLDKSRLPDHQAAFAAFSLGRRMCIGKNYALVSMKTTLAHLIRSFRFKSDISKLQLKLDIMLKPHDGHHISVERRT